MLCQKSFQNLILKGLEINSRVIDDYVKNTEFVKLDHKGLHGEICRLRLY